MKGEKGLSGPNSVTPSVSDTDLPVPFVDDSTRKKWDKTLIVCSVLVVSRKTIMA